jgi:hypothetical protein
MIYLNGFSSLPPGACHVDEVGVGGKELAERFHVVLVPCGYEAGDKLPHILLIVCRRKNIGR